MEFSLNEMDGFTAGNYVMYDYFAKTAAFTNEERLLLLKMRRRQFFYHIVAPLIEDKAVIGDVSKHVALSDQIIKSYAIGVNQIDLTLEYPAASRCHLVIYSKSRPTAVFFGQILLEEKKANDKSWSYDAKNGLLNILNSNISQGIYSVKIAYL